MQNTTDKSLSGQDQNKLPNAEPRSHTSMPDMSHIKGWGVDANPKNDPTYPMRQRDGEDSKNYDWQRPPMQAVNTEILRSNERPNLTATFGTSAPPSGLSGMIRRLAFKYSEGRIGHWLALLLADRINVVEGVVEDLAKGHIPNIFSESGMKAKWKHNPQAEATKVVIGLVVVTGIIFLLKRKRED